MGGASVRTGFTSRGIHALSAWNRSDATYSICMLNLGNNFNSKLEVVSSLNLLNIANCNFDFTHTVAYSKYNLKVYLGTVQSVANGWLYDIQTGQTNGLQNIVPGAQKSGS